MTDIVVRYAADSLPAVAAVVLAAALLLVVGTRLVIIDALSHRLPDRIIFPSYPVVAVLLGAAGVLAGEPARLLTMAGGAVLLWVVYFVLRTGYPAGLGFGDVKLAGLLGLYLGFAGWGYLLWGTVAAFVMAGCWGLILIILRRGTLQSAIAFGPFMIAGAVLALTVPSLG